MVVAHTISIITPTFNRAKLLMDLYLSIEKQKYKLHEWIIIDDGSEDSTELVVSGLCEVANNIGSIIYIKQPNQGKPAAVNRGLNHVTGDLVCVVDSDDVLFPDSFERIYGFIGSFDFMENDSLSSISGLKIDTNGATLSFEAESQIEVMSHFEWFYKHKRTGDRFDILKSKALENLRLNVFPGEKFITEDSLWLRVAGMKVFINDVLLIVDYQPGGLTSQYATLLEQNPFGMASYYHTLLTCASDMTALQKIKFSGMMLYYVLVSIFSRLKFHGFLGVLVAPAIFIYKKIRV